MEYQQQAEALFQKLPASGIGYDVEKIKKAYALALEAHKNQKRLSGDPYIIHPLAVAEILAEMSMDTDSIVAAFLHDVVEDTDISLAYIEKIFGEEVAALVDGVTKLGRIPYSTRVEQQSENLRKMLIAMAKDIRVIVIKLADRLHNMRTIEARDEQKRRDTALETMEVYAPIAHRLGMRRIKEILEDISLRYLDPVAYKEIERSLYIRKEERELFLEEIKKKILTRLKETLSYEVHIEGRVKSLYGIYRKMYLQGRAFDEIYDIYAVRIIVDSIVDCYSVLGVIHDIMHPIPGRFKDYISTPKPNMYQSLHTTVIGKEGVPFEVQIRTWEMHYTAEYGIAAHWKYKLGLQGEDSLDKRLAWIRQLLDIQRDADDVEDFMKSLKTDLSIDEVFVFTPKGDVINLPSKSTVIDFAYAIHSQIGNRMIGAKVGGKIVNLEYQLHNGDIVEIITTNAEGHGPNRDWLNVCRTSEARNKIRQWFKRERREENIAQGRDEIDRELKRNNIRMDEKERTVFIGELAKKLRYNTAEEFYAAIGYGGLSMTKVMTRIREEYQRIKESMKDQVEEVAFKPKTSGGVIIEGVDGCLVKFARCCNPLPGDPITGFITRGYGVSIHKQDCLNVQNAIASGNQPERWVSAVWDSAVSEQFQSSLRIMAGGNETILADIASLLAAMHVAIISIHARRMKGGDYYVDLVLTVSSLEHLEIVVQRLTRVQGVASVSRLNS